MVELKILNLDDEKPNNVPQDQWDRMKEVFDKIYDEDSNEIHTGTVP